MNITQGRSYQFLFLVFIVATLFVVFKLIDGNIWAEISKWLGLTVGGRAIGGDAVNKATEYITRKKKEIENDLESRSDADVASAIVKRSKQ